MEEQFYLVWAPLILITAWLIRRMRKRAKGEAASSQRPYLAVLALVAVVSFALSLVFTYVMPPAAFFSLPTRAWQLALGGLVALTADPVAPLTPPRRRGNRMDRTRLDPAGLRLVHRRHPLPGSGGTTAHRRARCW